MSVIDSTFPNGKPNTLPKKQFTGFFSLNEILKVSLKKVQTQIDNVQLIMRCENLPQIKTDYDEMVQLIDDLLKIILDYSPNASQLFLYIDCEEDNSDVIDMTLAEGYKRYIIKFHTNISTHENWKSFNSKALVNCRQILSRHNGNFAVNDLGSTGCLFSISLPGKME